MEKKKIDEKEFAALTEEILPHLLAVQKSVGKYIGNDIADFVFSGDGYMNFVMPDLEWQFHRLHEGNPVKLECKYNTFKTMEI